jgi:Radial spokehead-like protein
MFFLFSKDNDKPIKVNASYRPLSKDKLLKLHYWEHIKPDILKQGRVRYFDGRSLLRKGQDDDNDFESDIVSKDSEGSEAEVANNETNQDVPVPLFASCSGDRLTNDSISPWTIRLSDVLETPLVLLQSNIWPGAFAMTVNR